MEKVYNLSGLNSRYINFIEDVKNKTIVSKEQLLFTFLSILKDDPQIPFDLLSEDWVGDKAYVLFKDYLK